jgi:tetratricopeptide (TPR) repeat protein
MSTRERSGMAKMRRAILRVVLRAATLAGALAIAPCVLATPYAPSDDSHVLVVLPRALIADRSRIRELQDRLAAAPADVGAATELGRLYMRAARQGRNVLYFGYAESVLKPWFGRRDVPVETLAVRADINQYFHRFNDAVSDYGQVLGARPFDGSAWFGMAMALQNQGREEEALRVCQRLFRIDIRSWKRCAGEVASVGARVEQGYALLQNALEETSSQETDDRIWILTALGDAAARLGRTEEAERHLHSAFSIGPDSPSAYLPYVDFLIDAGRRQEALSALEHDSDTINGLLRRCLIYRATRDERLDPAQRDLALRLEYARLRGDMPYYNDEVRADLYLYQNPARAARVALQGWGATKTPTQARWLFEAAVAANDHEALEAVRIWLQEHAAAYPDLQRRMRELQGDVKK